MTLKPTLLTLALILSTPSFAQQEAENNRPISSISNATWEQYKDMYVKSPLCSSAEITLWNCETTKKTYALCASTHVDKKSGYIQYRASQHKKTIFTFPNTKIPPTGLFSYNTSANGDAFLEFSNAGYHYTLIDPLRDSSAIEVTSQKNQNKSTRISCNSGSQSLQLNYTMRLMFDAGVWSGH